MQTLPSNVALIAVDTRTTIKTIELPLANMNPGRIVYIKDAFGTAAVRAISIITGGGNLIDNASSYILSVNRASITLISDGVNSWHIIALYSA